MASAIAMPEKARYATEDAGESQIRDGVCRLEAVEHAFPEGKEDGHGDCADGDEELRDRIEMQRLQGASRDKAPTTPRSEREPQHEYRNDHRQDRRDDPERSEGQAHPHDLVEQAAKPRDEEKPEEQAAVRQASPPGFLPP
jgi:hypothetical protein